MYKAQQIATFKNPEHKRRIIELWVCEGEGFHENEKEGVISFEIGDVSVETFSGEDLTELKIMCLFLDVMDGMIAHRKIDKFLEIYDLLKINEPK